MPVRQYKEIFNQRGDAYHRAMELCPDARRREFTIPLGLLDLADGDLLCDFPSGGGYIRRFLPPDRQNIKLIPLEVSKEFAAKQRECRLATWAELPLPDASVNAVISLAALHHCHERESFYREAHRVLKPGGKLLIGDVEEGSVQGRFLNGFVNRYNSAGHDGDFLNATAESARIADAGFEIVHRQRHDYSWDFADQPSMTNFCAGLFGLDQACPDTIAEGLSGLCRPDSPLEINWGLLFIMGHKTALAN